MCHDLQGHTGDETRYDLVLLNPISGRRLKVRYEVVAGTTPKCDPAYLPEPDGPWVEHAGSG